ncbi:hypothetical protein GOP47_0017434 [Adiantum capillus-veneris]|uniref:Uncharacterized protein n=1 Tax=Adiantum capillus-veneris TaxID=13818 RepID=A0A9D4UFB9_ADICA|nr:hypothetical protein GOP47_0017434 [Adiantum capillus-veneris]
MGSCLSKPSSKGNKKKKRKEAHCVERDTPVHEKKPWKTSGEEAEEEEEEEAAPSRNARAASPRLSITEAIQQQPLPAPSVSSLTETAESREPQRLTTSPSAQKAYPSPSLSPDTVTLPLTAQTPMRKHSGEFPVNSLRRPSSPCKALLLKMPASPAGMKKSTSLHRTEEDDCKFPSLARKQWLSQACINKEDDTLTMRGNESAGDDASKCKNSSSRDTLMLASRETADTMSKDLGQRTSRKMKEEIKTKDLINGSKLLVADAPPLTNKTAPSRTNSLSRDLSPVELSRARARPSSPLKRSPSIKDHSGAAPDGPPRLIRSSSGKVSSPNRAGLQAAERHDSMKSRALHKQSHSKEYIPDPVADPSAHKRSSSRETVSEFSAEIIRRPSPPKKTPIVVPSSMSSSSFEGGRLNVKRPSTPSKENLSLHKSSNQEPSSIAKGGKVSAQRSLSIAVHESENLTTSSNNRNGKRKEKSPLRRTCNGMATSTRNTDRMADVSINSDTTVASQFDLVGKDQAARTRRPPSRIPLKELNDNTTRSFSSRLGTKEKIGAAAKANDAHDLQVKEERTKGYPSVGKTDEKVACDFPNSLNDYVKDSLEVKAESLVMGGNSVLSAFKALEEYRMKYSNSNSETYQGAEEDAWYSRPQPYTVDKEHFSQPLQGSEMGKALPKTNSQQAQELPRSRSAKKSCEQFFFPDVQSLLASENEGFQLDGGMAMPASISKACSILRAVADLNMGTSTYPKKKEVQDEIERPNLLSFQFGEGDSDRVTLS